MSWASPTPLHLAEAIRRADPRIVWVGGLAETWAPPVCAVGARGFTSGLTNVCPERSMAIHAALASSDYTRANTLIAKMSAFEALRSEEGNGTNVTVVKSALQTIDKDCGHVRPPRAWPLTERQSRGLRQALKQWGVLTAPHAATA